MSRNRNVADALGDADEKQLRGTLSLFMNGRRKYTRAAANIALNMLMRNGTETLTADHDMFYLLQFVKDVWPESADNILGMCVYVRAHQR